MTPTHEALRKSSVHGLEGRQTPIASKAELMAEIERIALNPQGMGTRLAIDLGERMRETNVAVWHDAAPGGGR